MTRELLLKGLNALLGIQIKNMESGGAELSVPIMPDLLNSAGTVHGGGAASAVEHVAFFKQIFPAKAGDMRHPMRAVRLSKKSQAAHILV